jgi:hypothetical protein
VLKLADKMFATRIKTGLKPGSINHDKRSREGKSGIGKGYPDHTAKRLIP